MNAHLWSPVKRQGVQRSKFSIVVLPGKLFHMSRPNSLFQWEIKCQLSKKVKMLIKTLHGAFMGWYWLLWPFNQTVQ